MKNLLLYKLFNWTRAVIKLCSPAEMHASFKLNFFVFITFTKKISIFQVCFFFFLFFMSIGHRCVFEAQIFCRKNSSSDVTSKHSYISFKRKKEHFLRNWEQLFASLQKGSVALYICWHYFYCLNHLWADQVQNNFHICEKEG